VTAAPGDRLDGRIRRHAWQSLVLQGAAVGFLFAMNAVLGRLLGPEQYGRFSFGLTVAGLAALAFSLGLPNGVMRFVAEYAATGRWALLRGVVIRTGQWVAALALVGAAMLLAARAVVPGLGAGAREGLAYAAVMLPLVALGLWRSRAARGLERLTVSMLPEEVLVPLAVIAIALAWPLASAAGAVVAWAAATAVALAGGTLWLVAVLPAGIRGVVPEFDGRLWLRVSMPMILGGLMQLAANRGDVVLLGLLRDMSETGVYVGAARIALLGTFALRVVDTYTAPMIAGAFHAGRADEVRSIFRRGVAYSAAGAVPLCLIALLWPEPLLRLFGEAFVPGATVLRILALGQLVNAVTGPVGFTLLMTGHERLFAGMMTSASAAGLVAGLLVIPVWGGEGAAVVAASTAAAVNVAMLVAVRRKVLRRGPAEEPR